MLRLLLGQTGGPWPQLVAQGVVAMCPPVEAELMVGVRAERDFEPFTVMLRRTFGWVPALDDPWRQVLAVRRDLIKIGQHRGPSPMDLDNDITDGSNGSGSTVLDPWGGERWCTTSQLQELLHWHGLDVGDLTPVAAPPWTRGIGDHCA